MPPRRRSPRTTPHHHHQPPSSSSSSSSSSTVRRSPRLTLSSPTHLALVLYHHPLQSQQQPQPLKIHKPRLLHLLHASSNTPLRRSPRLLGASIGLSNGRCGSQLLLRLPEKEACKLARECLDDRDLSVKRLRSRTLRPASGSGSAGQNSTLHRKRMRDSGQNFDQAPVNWSDRISDGSDDLRHLALPSLEMEGGLEGKRRNLDYRRNSDGTSENRGFQRRSTRFSGEKSGKPLSGEKSIGDNYGKLGRKSQEKVILALPSSSMAEKSRNIDKVHSRKTIVLPDDTPENAEFRQCSSRVSGEKAVQSSSRKELSDKDEEKEEKETKDVLSSSPSSSMVEPSPCIELLNSTPERSDDSAFRLRVSAMMEEIFGTFEEEKKVVRRSPRGLSSICLVDDYQCDEMKEMTMRSSKKKKKKEQEKVAKETTRKKSKASGSSPVSMDGEDKIKEELAGTETETETERESKSCFFVGEAVPEEEAHKKWGWRYQLKVI